MDRDSLGELMATQEGLVSRRQALAHGATPADLRRLVRRREWAAVLFAAPAALCAQSALRAANGPGHRHHDETGAIHIAVDHSRTVVTPSGVVARRFVALEARVQWNLTPPRMRIEEAVVDVAAKAVDDCSAIAVRVERPHGLPTGLRQVKESSRGPVYRDVHYSGLCFLVELDGRLDHTRVRDRDRDLERDLDAALDGLLTVRLGWGQAVGRPCETAKKVARVLQRRGWTGSPRRCEACPAEDPVDLGPPGDSRSTP